MTIDVKWIAEEGIEILRPVGEAFRSPEGLAVLLRQLGFERDSGTLGASVASSIQLVAKIESLVASQVAGIESSDQAIAVIADIVQAQKELSRVIEALSLLGVPPAKTRELGEYLLLNRLCAAQPILFNLLLLLRVASVEAFRANGAAGSPEADYTAARIDWSNLVKALTDPAKLAREAYGWGTPNFDCRLMLVRLSRLVEALGVRVYTDDLGPLLVKAVAPSFNNSPPWLTEFLLLVEEGETASARVGVAVMPVDGASADDIGIGLMPVAEGNLVAIIPLTDTIAIDLVGLGVITGGLVALVRPKSGVTVKVGIQDGNVGVAAVGAIKLRWASPSEFALLGSDAKSRLAVSNGFAELRFSPEDIIFELGTLGAALVLQPSEGDGFLKTILPKDGFRTDVDLAVGWSSRKGIYFRGSAGLEVTLPVHMDVLGVLRVESIYLALRTTETNNKTAIETVAAGTVTVKLGPFTASVERIGLIARLTFPPTGGNLGPANLEIGFKPPDGAGMAIDGDAINGGGYLLFDPTNEQYAGILQLEIKGGISLKAIGLLTTRLPGLPPGTKGFSLLVIISAEFPAIQLGFGFSLTGVGGLLGVNRTMVLEVLRSGVKDHSLDSILFPVKPVENAQRIISDLQGVFPPATGRFVFGPMAKLAWGRPATILTIELGIVLELPAPVRLAIMGRLHMALPSQEVKDDLQVVVLRMDVLGTIDFDKGDASIDAILYDSRVAKFAISGGMAMRLNWGASPAFALAVGGFNPRFQPPPNFPAVDRLAISLATDDSLQLRLEAYFAQTSNTVQFGARLDLYAAKDVTIIKTFRISVEAYLGFDGLIQSPPLSFIIDIYGGAAIKVDGNALFAVKIQVAFSGFTPLHACGEATFDFLGAKQRIPIDWTLGDTELPPLPPPVDVLAELRTALADPRSWSAQLPSDGHMLVTLRQIAAAKDEVLMHPFGELTVRQKVVPLDMAISKFGSGTPSSPGPFRISEIWLDGQPTTAPSASDTVRDLFAPGQFFEMSDDEKLSQPAFQALPSGRTRIGTTAIRYGTVRVPASFEYDTVVIDNKEKLAARRGDGLEYEMPEAVLLATAALGAAGQSAMRASGSAKFAGGSSQKVTLKAPTYLVASTEDMTLDADTPQASYAEAAAARRLKGGASKLHQVMGSHEVA